MGSKEWQEKGNGVMNLDKIMRIIRRRFVPGFTLAVRLGLGCMFIYSSLPKIRQPYDFLASVYNYELVGPKLGMLTAMALPWAELLVGVCLVGGIFVSGALLASIAMAVLFTSVLASVLYRGLEISCGCFSTSGEAISYMTLIRACVILLLAVAAYISLVMLQDGAAG
jgi:uncharacterized membrane protein YphA (DoxX/SURF4 family)